jgi:positive phototaxis protein PixI
MSTPAPPQQAPSQQAPSQQALQQFLRLQLPGNVQAMVKTQQLTEILSLNVGQVVPISDTSPAMMGVCNWRGDVLWLLDLGCWLGMEPLYAQSLRQGKLNVVIIQHLGKTLGLGVDQVEQMIWCDPAEIQTLLEPDLSPALAACLQGYWSVPGEAVVLVLNGEDIINGQTNEQT